MGWAVVDTRSGFGVVFFCKNGDFGYIIAIVSAYFLIQAFLCIHLVGYVTGWLRGAFFLSD